MERTLPALRTWSVTPLARLVAIAAAFAGAILLLGAAWVTPTTETADAWAYRLAAERLLSGDPLYPPTAPDGGTVYRYSPWFAVAWVPFALAGDAGFVVWRVLLAAAALYVVVTTFRMGGHAALILAVLALPMLGAVPSGNVELLIAAGLLWRRADPWSVGLAASLKVYPLLLCFGYAAERRWRDIGIAVGIAAVLWLPALWFGLGDYPTSPGRGGSWLWDSGLWWVTTPLLLAALTVMAWRRSRWTWLLAAVSPNYVVPRYLGGTLTYVYAAITRSRPSTD